MSMDGEAMILKEAMDPVVQKACEDADTDLLKVSAGTTACQNPCDISKCFSTLKRGLGGLIKNQVDYSNPTLKVNLEHVFELARDPLIHNITVTAEETHKIIDAILQIVYQAQNSPAYRPNTGKDAFRIGGQHCNDLGDGQSVSMNKIMGLCYTRPPHQSPERGRAKAKETGQR